MLAIRMTGAAIAAKLPKATLPPTNAAIPRSPSRNPLRAVKSRTPGFVDTHGEAVLKESEAETRFRSEGSFERGNAQHSPRVCREDPVHQNQYVPVDKHISHIPAAESDSLDLAAGDQCDLLPQGE